MMGFTKDEVQEALNLSAGHALSATDAFRLHKLARQLLASMEQEPIILYRERNPVTGMATGWVELTQEEYGFIKDHSSEDADFKRVYAAPQLPQPVEPEITSEELDDELLEQLIDFRRDTLNYHKKEGNRVQTVMHGVVLRAALELQERRAAMLQGTHRDLSHPVDPQVAAYEKIMEQAVPDNSFTDQELEGMAHGDNPQANAYRELLAYRLSAGGWIPCSERMPEKYDFDIWVFSPSEGVQHSYGLHGGSGEFSDMEMYSTINDVTHWMPMESPSAPQQEAK